VIREAAPEVVVVPGLVVGATDTRHYARITENGFRFLPIRIGADDPERVHGRDERVSVENHRFAIDFFERLVRRAAGEEPTAR
jgi:carboxypeptidase PM20D1